MNELVHTQAPSFSLSPAPNLIFVSQPGEIHSQIPTQPGSLGVL